MFYFSYLCLDITEKLESVESTESFSSPTESSRWPPTATADRWAIREAQSHTAPPAAAVVTLTVYLRLIADTASQVKGLSQVGADCNMKLAVIVFLIIFICAWNVCSSYTQC